MPSIKPTLAVSTTEGQRNLPSANMTRSNPAMKPLYSIKPATMNKKEQPTMSSSRSIQSKVTPSQVSSSTPAVKPATANLASVIGKNQMATPRMNVPSDNSDHISHQGDHKSCCLSDPTKKSKHSLRDNPCASVSTPVDATLDHRNCGDKITNLNMDGSLFHVGTTENEIALVFHEPRPIEGTAGSRIRVTLGDTGSNSFLLLLDEDDGERTWQSKSWCNIPSSLDQQLRRTNYVYHCCYSNSTKEWFLSAQCGETNKIQYFWSLQSPEI
jgi:hypothetical protein